MTDTVTAPSLPEEKISEPDKHILDMMVMQRKVFVSAAEKAIAENNASEANYKLALYQLYAKYAMDPQKDAIDENGAIKRDAVKPQ